MPADLVLDGNFHIQPANPRFGKAARARPEQINDLELMLRDQLDDCFRWLRGRLKRQAVALDCDQNPGGSGLLDDLGRVHSVALHRPPMVSCPSPAETFAALPVFASRVGWPGISTLYSFARLPAILRRTATQFPSSIQAGRFVRCFWKSLPRLRAVGFSNALPINSPSASASSSALSLSSEITELTFASCSATSWVVKVLPSQRFLRMTSTRDKALASSSPASPARSSSVQSMLMPRRPAAYSTGQPISPHHVLKRVFATCPWGRCKTPPSKMVYKARKIFSRFACVHADGSACMKALFSGSGRSTFNERMNDRLAMSPRGAIELPVKIWTVVAGTVSKSETPSTRSEISEAVSAASMCRQLIVAPRAMLSQTSDATTCRRYENSAFLRSSTLSDHAAAAGRRPKTAAQIMLIKVVLPPPR